MCSSDLSPTTAPWSAPASPKSAPDHISTGDGNGNYVMAGGGSDVVIGGEGREYIRAGVAFTWPGMVDDDTVYGGQNTDMIYGGIGDDWLWGDSDDDQWQQHNGQSHQRGDWISGEAGSDHIYGSSAKDVLFGDAGSDDIKGGAGDDFILGDAQYSVQAEPHGTGYRFTLGAGISFMQQQRVADDDNWPQTFFCHQPNMPFIAPITPFIGSWA